MIYMLHFLHFYGQILKKFLADGCILNLYHKIRKTLLRLKTFVQNEKLYSRYNINVNNLWLYYTFLKDRHFPLRQNTSNFPAL